MNNAIIATDSGIMEEIVNNWIEEKRESLEIFVCQIDCFYASLRTIIMHHLPGVQKEHIKL